MAERPDDRGPRADRRRAYRAARASLALLGVEPQDLAIELIALARGVRVVTADLTGADAILVRAGSRGVITVSRRLTPRGRRFAIAHELGHFDLHGDRSQLGLCTGDLHASAYSSEPFEQEANAYASEHLMPRRAFLELMADAEASWDVVKDLAETFDVSLTAAALRFASLHPGRVAFVVVRDGAVVWSARSWRWRTAIPRGMPVAEGSGVGEAGSSWNDRRRVVAARTWGADAEEACVVVEHAFQTRRTGIGMVLIERIVRRIDLGERDRA